MSQAPGASFGDALGVVVDFHPHAQLSHSVAVRLVSFWSRHGHGGSSFLDQRSDMWLI